MNRHPFIPYLSGLLTLFGLISCHQPENEIHESVKYAVAEPVIMDTSVIQDYVASIQSRQNIEIRAKVDGYLDTIHIDEGQLVHKGQLLFTIRPREYQAELMKARAELKMAELESQNAKSLSDKNIISPNELAAANARVDQAKADVAIAELNVSYAEIRAPFEGVIDRIPKKTGSLIEKGELLTTLSDNRQVYAYFNVSEQEYLNYMSKKKQDGDQSVSLVMANNQLHMYAGKIQTVESEFNAETGCIPFRAEFPNPDLLLRHGETGKVRLTIPVHEAVVIPQKATYELQDKTFVYVVDEKGAVHSRNIKISHRLSNLYIIGEGLAAQDKILLEGVQYVKDDDTIIPVPVAPENALVTFSKK